MRGRSPAGSHGPRGRGCAGRAPSSQPEQPARPAPPLSSLRSKVAPTRRDSVRIHRPNRVHTRAGQIACTREPSVPVGRPAHRSTNSPSDGAAATTVRDADFPPARAQLPRRRIPGRHSPRAATIGYCRRVAVSPCRRVAVSTGDGRLPLARAEPEDIARTITFLTAGRRRDDRRGESTVRWCAHAAVSGHRRTSRRCGVCCAPRPRQIAAEAGSGHPSCHRG